MKKKSKPVLSYERTLLSNERTLLSYIRTAFAVIVAGVVFIGFFKEGTLSVVGVVLVFVGLALLLLGIVYYFFRKKKIEKEC